MVNKVLLILENPYLISMQNHLQDLFTSGDDKLKISNSFENEINSDVLRDMICYLVWDRKGKVEGIHPDFGKLSYTQSPKISSHYHVNDEERIEMLMDINENLTKF